MDSLINDKNSLERPSDNSDLVFFYPTAWRLRSKQRCDDGDGGKIVATEKKKSRGKKK